MRVQFYKFVLENGLVDGFERVSRNIVEFKCKIVFEFCPVFHPRLKSGGGRVKDNVIAFEFKVLKGWWKGSVKVGHDVEVPLRAYNYFGGVCVSDSFDDEFLC